MKIIRHPHIDDKTPCVIRGYDRINLYLGNIFIDQMAREASHETGENKRLVFVDLPVPNTTIIRHTATLVDAKAVPLVSFYGVWPDAEGKYDLPQGCIDL